VIFVTVGTHEQPMDRLMRALDALPADARPAGEPLVVQYGWSTVVPTVGPVRAEKLLPFDEVQRCMAAARVVVTHGGPASILQALSHGKVPVVVPRDPAHGEHVDDHQVRFAERIAGRVVLVRDPAQLGPALATHAATVADMPPDSHGPARARAFAERLDALCRDLVSPGPQEHPMATLREGDTVPDFTLPDQDGTPVSLSGLLARGPLVLYFYPKDDTPGCTKEACSFRDSHTAFSDAGATVVGVSSDDPASHRAFIARHRLPFTLLSDAGGELRRRLGVKKTLGLIEGRVTFVIGQDARVRKVFSSQFLATRHVEESLAALRG
jgi:peroxiredoxin Q/BCP